ncbi:Coenzyme Q-binding protein coq10a, mitochondrial [Coemansia guatemalensis]|uniref:Coenzyme Q-binding protein coq10a, mitochondrial n=1 Tax=Coemansia guatemalensis TaxID=2761395 RepID=A0A9W8HTB2_9FUNG|nr:Coenzyme Q-binding protein coq10a, mitochondrial [Coemansia guatemalensis]
MPLLSRVQRSVVGTAFVRGRRSFLLFSAGVGQRGSRQRFQDSQVFPYAREQVFDLVADVDRYREYVPMCTESAVLHNTWRVERVPAREPAKQSTERRSVQAVLAVGYPPFHERYTSDVVLERPWRITATADRADGMFKYMRTVWDFACAPAGAPKSRLGSAVLEGGEATAHTLVRFSIEYEFASALHAHAASLVFDKMARSNMAAYLARSHALYGA